MKQEPKVQGLFACCFCTQEATVIYKGTSICRSCLDEKTRTGAI